MSNFLILLMVFALVLNLACTGYIAFAFRQRHRFLFNQTLELRDGMTRLADALRIEHRLSDIQHARTSLDSSLPVRFTAQAGEDILIYDFFKSAPVGFFVETIDAYLQDRGYCGVGSKGCNLFFVPADRREQFLSLPGHVG